MEKNNCFSQLCDDLVRNGIYNRTNIHFVEYASMDDQAAFEDFADKLDEDYEKKVGSFARPFESRHAGKPESP